MSGLPDILRIPEVLIAGPRPTIVRPHQTSAEPRLYALRARKMGFLGAFFANFVTGFAPSKIPSVTRDRFESFRKFWAL
jgi:hypothetical protein